MARPVDIAYQSLTSAATGFIVGYSPEIIPSAYTDWIMAGGAGVAGILGASMGRGAVERIGLGAVDGAASFIGTKMATYLRARTAPGTVTPAPTPTTFAQPKLVNFETAKASAAKNAPRATQKSVLEI